MSMGVCRRVLKPMMCLGRFLRESSCCRQPYSGNPTVRDEKGDIWGRTKISCSCKRIKLQKRGFLGP